MVKGRGNVLCDDLGGASSLCMGKTEDGFGAAEYPA